MLSVAEQSSTYRYAVFHYVTGDPKDREVPVGVALWSPEDRWSRLQLLREGETVAGAPARDVAAYVRATEEQLREWVREERVPYYAGDARPSDDAWWRAVRDLLRFRVQVSAPRPLDCQSRDAEFELLYDAIVAPKRSAASKRQRIDHAISRAIKPSVSHYFRPKVRVPAFDGDMVEVLRAYTAPQRQVILEGANLAVEDPVTEADSLASRMRRILEAGGIRTRFVIGIVCPPGGLNGTAHLKRWLEVSGGSRVFNLTNESEAFSAAAEKELAAAQRDLKLFEV